MKAAYAVLLSTFAISAPAVADTYRCDFVKQTPEYSVEVSIKDKLAAFFNNDSWAIAKLKRTSVLESNPPQTQYEFEGRDDAGDRMTIIFNATRSRGTFVGNVGLREEYRTPLKCFKEAPTAMSSGITTIVKKLAQCTVTQVVDSNHFEEGLSVEEYPDVYVKEDSKRGLSVSVGAMLDWNESSGDLIQPLATVGFDKAWSFTRKGDRDAYTLSIKARGNVPLKTGSLSVRENGARTSKLLATLSCK